MADPFRAILDIGTNSLKIIAVQVRDDGLHTLMDKELISRLGEGAMNTGKIQPEAQERTIKAIEELLDDVKLFTPETIDIVGTSILRTANNSDEFVEEVFDKYGIRVRLLSRNEEAVAAFLAARSEFQYGKLVILDVGGGSAEIAYGNNEHPSQEWSFRLGARELYSRFPLGDPPDQSKFTLVQNYINSVASEIKEVDEEAKLVLVGGSATALAGYARAMMGAPGELVATKLYSETLDSLIKLLGDCTLEERKELPGSNPDRADVMVHAAIAVRELMQRLGKKEAYISHCEIGHGVLEAERLGIPLESDDPEVVLPGTDFPPFNRKNRGGEVIFLLRRPDGKIWLQTKSTYPDGYYRIPGGGIDYEEAPGDALKREIEEETGFLIDRAALLLKMRYKSGDGWKVPFATYMYLVDVPETEPVANDPNEPITGWIAVNGEECEEWAQKWENIKSEQESWGIFRAAALHYAAILANQGSW